MRFRAEQHLRRPPEIRAVREQGRRIECRAFTLWWKRRATPPVVGRVCVIASRSAVGSAVRRNRAKRRLREVFRHHQQQLPPDCDILLIARANAITWPLPELKKKFSEACAQIGQASS
jgi:ribonuclease P protein component